MKTFKQNRDTFFLPEDIIEQILLKLPTKSLLRFKSVRKQWLSLISHPNFFQSQLKLVLSLQNQKIMAASSDCYQFYLLNQDGNTLPQKYNLPFSPSSLDGVHLLGSCNGLLCLGIYTNYSHLFSHIDYFYNPILWNPLLNDYKKVPFFVPHVISLFGFGYDSHTEDYKFVKVKLNEVEAEVYSLKSNSIERVPFQLPHISHLQRRVGRFFNGSLYWISLDVSFGLEVIVFDLRYEKFRFLKFPYYTIPIDLTIVRDYNSLGVFFCDREDNEYFNLGMMKEDSSENGSLSWNMIKIQHPEGNLCLPICCVMNGEIVVMNRENDLLIHTTQWRMTKKIAFHGAKDWSEYVHSLRR